MRTLRIPIEILRIKSTTLIEEILCNIKPNLIPVHQIEKSRTIEPFPIRKGCRNTAPSSLACHQVASALQTIWCVFGAPFRRRELVQFGAPEALRSRAAVGTRPPCSGGAHRKRPAFAPRPSAKTCDA